MRDSNSNPNSNSGSSNASAVDSYLLPSSDLLKKKLPEWRFLESLLPELEKLGDVSIVGSTTDDKYKLPLYAFQFGSKDPEAPVLGLFGGVHGLERIGAQVCLSLLKSFSELLLWDSLTHEALKKVRVVAIPMVNPLGMLHLRRSNPHGVDLMRNSPVMADDNQATFLVGGHRISPKLPWYQGTRGLESESQAVVDFCQKQFFQSKAVISIDFHSGFGVQDQLWFPYAKSVKPFPHLAELHALKEVMDRTYPHHFYRIEPQAKNYTTHGDLWDYIYDLYRAQNSTGIYLPLALEMGSWLWVKKNPWQLFSTLGPFNPLKPHRQKRILRRHMTLFDFLIRSLVSPQTWASLNQEQHNKQQTRALELWYGER